VNAWTYQFTDEAKRRIRKLEKPVQAKIVVALDRLAGTGHGDVKKLAGTVNDWRLRVGDYRVIFRRGNDRLVILVLELGHRRDVYR